MDDEQPKPPSDCLPVYHCHRCRERVVGYQNWLRHLRRCVSAGPYDDEIDSR